MQPRLSLAMTLAASLWILLLAPRSAVAQEGRPVALELVLAVDCSSSVSDQEFALQMVGIAQAFRDPEVQAALHAAGQRGVAVAMLQWSGAAIQREAIDWRLIDSAQAAEDLAEEIDSTPRFVGGGPTAIGTAIEVATRWIIGNDFEGSRKVIDVSGDGRANQGIAASVARIFANGEGVTINGLAILNEEENLHHYYQAGVIGGPGAFMIATQDYKAFAKAIRRKLVYEITGPPVATLEPQRPSGQLRQAAERSPAGQIVGK